MHKQHANTNFSAVLQDDLSPDAHNIINLMTANASIYTSPTIPLVTVSRYLAAWDSTLNAAPYTGQTGDLKNNRTALEMALNTNGIYVNSIAKGDLAMLEKSGYTISVLHAPVGDLLAPTSVAVAKGTAALTFDFNIAVVLHAHGYLIAFTPVSNTVTDQNLWTIKWSHKHKNTFGGFVKGVEYKFAACGVGSTNNVFWTNSHTTLFAQ
ncbi:MAG TPA: hypothetical protein VF411_16025 [Bacteroidia bacterium]